jgi:AbrB family looped-hinge helix DNA binding protein
MRTTIDSGGRVVVPKRMRDLLGLVAGSVVEIELDGSGTGLKLEPAQPQTELVEVDGVLVADTSPGDALLTDDDVRATLEATRQRHL